MAVLKGFAISEFIGSPNVAYLAIFPVVTVIGPSRRYLIEELVRPPSRREHVRAVGLALAAVVVVGWLLIQMVGVLAIVIWGRRESSVAGIWEAAAFSLCCLPVLLVPRSWPYRIVVRLYDLTRRRLRSHGIVPPDTAEAVWIRSWSVPALAILFVGLLLTRASYLRWLNHDAVPGPPLFGSRESEGGWDRDVAACRD